MNTDWLTSTPIFGFLSLPSPDPFENLHSVWRIENSDGIGPYQARPMNCDYSDWSWRSANRWYHPVPENDLALRDRYYRSNSDDIYGFESILHYIKWFNQREWREKLKKHGFFLVEYDAQDATRGEYQVMFNRKRAKKLRQLKPTNFDNDAWTHVWEIR